MKTDTLRYSFAEDTWTNPTVHTYTIRLFVGAPDGTDGDGATLQNLPPGDPHRELRRFYADRLVSRKGDALRGFKWERDPQGAHAEFVIPSGGTVKIATMLRDGVHQTQYQGGERHVMGGACPWLTREGQEPIHPSLLGSAPKMLKVSKATKADAL